MLKILQARLQQYVNCDLPDVQVERQRNPRWNFQHPLDCHKSKRVPEKKSLLLYWLGQALWLCGSQQAVENSSRNGNIRLPALWKTCMQVKKEELELDMKKQTGSKLGKEYTRAIYCHHGYLTYMKTTSWEMTGWINTDWNQDCWETYQ